MHSSRCRLVRGARSCRHRHRRRDHDSGPRGTPEDRGGARCPRAARRSLRGPREPIEQSRAQRPLVAVEERAPPRGRQGQPGTLRRLCGAGGAPAGRAPAVHLPGRRRAPAAQRWIVRDLGLGRRPRAGRLRPRASKVGTPLDAPDSSGHSRQRHDRVGCDAEASDPLRTRDVSASAGGKGGVAATRADPQAKPSVPPRLDRLCAGQ